jgi:hypothetical protein
MIIRISGEGRPIQYGVWADGRLVTNVERAFVWFAVYDPGNPRVWVHLSSQSVANKQITQHPLGMETMGADLRLHVRPSPEQLALLEFDNGRGLVP